MSRELTLFSPLKPTIATCRREGHTTERSFLGGRNVRFVPTADIRDFRRCRERTDKRVRVRPVNKPTYRQGQDWGGTEGFSDQDDSSAPPARLPGDDP